MFNVIVSGPRSRIPHPRACRRPRSPDPIQQPLIDRLDPVTRPETSNLVLLTALCEELDPRKLAEQIGSRGAAELKRRATEAVNGHLRPIRDRRAELMRDRDISEQSCATEAPVLEASPKKRLLVILGVVARQLVASASTVRPRPPRQRVPGYVVGGHALGGGERAAHVDRRGSWRSDGGEGH
jgi:hypothetical protein